MQTFSFLLRYEGTIYLLSALCSLLFALVIFGLISSAKILEEKKWATPFAQTFLVLALLYLLRLINYGFLQDAAKLPVTEIKYLAHYLIRFVVAVCSGLTNYLFILTAFRLSQHALENARLRRLTEWLSGRDYLRSPLLWLLVLGSVVGLFGGFARSPDLIFSAFALILMGLVLYQNISVRRYESMAWVALLSAVGYALLYLARGVYFIVSQLPSGGTTIATRIVGLGTILISLGLKFGLFFSGYSLMLLISGPLQGIEHLLENVTRKQKEYLESDGLIKSICEELRTRSVGLYIRLPGLKEKRMALYDYPSSNNGNKQTPREFSYREGENYHWVMTSGKTSRIDHENSLHPLIPNAPKVGVPVFFHNSVIACLEAEIGEQKFKEADQINLERIATLISPAVQTYREMSALNKINQAVAELQIGVIAFDTGRDVRGITKIIYDAMSPLATGLSIDLGFAKYRDSFSQDPELERSVNEWLKADVDENIDVGSDEHRWLQKALPISMVDSEGQKIGTQELGKLVLATDRKSKRREHPTLGTNAAYLHALSNLLTDTVLGFVRGNLNQLTDRLGVRLGGLKRTTAAAWLAEVEKTAREAKLLWTVASYTDNEKEKLLGTGEMVDTVKRIEAGEAKEKWERKEDGLYLYKLDPPENGTHHVIKKVLKSSKATLWLGVAREGFGPELDYVSPWKYFLDHFCEIADSALLRILINDKQKKRMGEVQSIIAGSLTLGTFTHDLINLTGTLVDKTTLLETFVDQKERRQTLSELHSVRDQIGQLLPKLTDTYQRDLRQPCSLDEAITRALERVEALTKYHIRVKRELQSDASIDIPFDAATNALAIVIDNAKDAIVEKLNKKIEKRKGELEWIRIKVQESEDQAAFICEISDSGLGVPPAIQATLLKEVTVSRKENSHGVGLLFSVDLLRLYNGDIILAKPGPDPSTTFSIYFPKVKDSSP